MSLTCLTDQMVNTRSGSGVDQPPVQRQRGGSSNINSSNMQNNNQGPQNQQNNQAPPPPPPAGMEQFLAAQTQLLTNMAQTMANIQAQMNQEPPPQQRDRHRGFMSQKPPTFSHAPDPL